MLQSNIGYPFTELSAWKMVTLKGFYNGIRVHSDIYEFFPLDYLSQ